MARIIQAICTNGELILNEKLGAELEGKTLKVLIFETSKIEDAQSRKDRIKRFLERAKKYSFKLPSDYEFDRDEYL